MVIEIDNSHDIDEFEENQDGVSLHNNFFADLILHNYLSTPRNNKLSIKKKERAKSLQVTSSEAAINAKNRNFTSVKLVKQRTESQRVTMNVASQSFKRRKKEKNTLEQNYKVRYTDGIKKRKITWTETSMLY